MSFGTSLLSCPKDRRQLHVQWNILSIFKYVKPVLPFSPPKEKKWQLHTQRAFLLCSGMLTALKNSGEEMPVLRSRKQLEKKISICRSWDKVTREAFAGNHTATITLNAVLDSSALCFFLQDPPLAQDYSTSNCGGFITSPEIHDKV